MLYLAIEAAVALDHLHLSTAKRLALDALNIAKSTPKEAAGLATVPACVAARRDGLRTCQREGDDESAGLEDSAPMDILSEAAYVAAALIASRIRE
jgi:hypothetical protein